MTKTEMKMSNDIKKHRDYEVWAEFIFDKIKLAKTKAAFRVNSEMLTLYWEIGKSIIEKQSQNGWGSKVIDILSTDLAKNFPDNSGFSVRNLKYMRTFAEAYPQFPIVQVEINPAENEFVQVPLAQITWYHHISLLTKVKDVRERGFYIAETAKNEWSRDIMLLQIRSKLYERLGKALNNFEYTLPDYQSDLAKSVFKDPYNFDFLMLSRKAKEVETIGLLLCASKSNVKVEYAMRGLTKPLGVASYELEQLVKENIDAFE